MSDQATEISDPQFTLGVVIPMPEPQRSVLREWRRKFGGADTESIDPHITLISGGYLKSWAQAAARVREVAQESSRFTVRLAAARSFQPASDVVYLPLAAGAERFWALHEALLAGPLRHESKFDYHPHLTIAQNVAEADLAAAYTALQEVDLRFEVHSVQLFDTRNGAWNFCEQIALGR